MIIKVRATVEKYGMLRKGAKVVAAVSGGSDSMAMLYILNSLKEEFGFELCAAHVNHGLRGESADRDERLVAEKCAEIGVPLHVLKADVAALASEKGIGVEECGRQVRYDFFNSLGSDMTIATAHNLSDRVETFLFNFARGGALRGLCSVPAVRDNIIRPLIDCSKAEIVDFCNKNSIEYATDETNSDVHYSRNRIRHNVVTELEKINPSFQTCALRCIDSLNEDEAFLRSLSNEIIEKSKKDGGYDASVIADAPAPVKKRALIGIIEREFGITPENKFINSLCALLESSGNLQINGGITVRVRKGTLDFPPESEQPESALFNDGKAVFGSAEIETEIININAINNLQNFSKQVLDYCLDCDKIIGKLTVRSRMAGDKITLASRGCTKSLKKLFNELSVPPEKRSCVAVIADDCGVVLVEGAGCDKRVAVTGATKRMAAVKIKRS
ncbi:MAG: tRNA lysidine(34) synthetase TilS [Oscillospiraceae bacterium]|nr:tRNA lysidine(34) synthetase TilS [Oscillospiraceae bacterium]